MNGERDDAGTLEEFFGRLAEDAALYNDYLTDPVRTMRDAGIPEHLISAVMTGNIKKLNELFTKDSGGPIVILGTIIRG